MGIDREFAVVRNLNDAGCDCRTKEMFLQLLAQGNTEEQLRLLRRHRIDLLAAVHDNQKKIDCLDYLAFRLERESSASQAMGAAGKAPYEAV